jgi:hypothetical protein
MPLACSTFDTKKTNLHKRSNASKIEKIPKTLFTKNSLASMHSSLLPLLPLKKHYEIVSNV